MSSVSTYPTKKKEIRESLGKSDYSVDLDIIFEMSSKARHLLSNVCQTASEKKSLAVIEYIDGQYQRYKTKLSKCNLLY